jgi:hypothetical protein
LKTAPSEHYAQKGELQMDEHTMSAISFTIGIMSFAGSIVFFFLGRKSEKTNRAILDSINKAINEWQSKLMASTIEILESRPEVIGSRTYLEDSKAKHEFWRSISERIKYIIENPIPGENAKDQVAALNLLLGTFIKVTESTLPPDVLANVMGQHITKNEENKNKPAQTSKK